MRHRSAEDGAASALSLLQPKPKLPRDLYIPRLVANVTKAHAKANHVFVTILTWANYKDSNRGSDPSRCCFTCTFSFFACLQPQIRYIGSQGWKITAVLCCCREHCHLRPCGTAVPIGRTFLLCCSSVPCSAPMPTQVAGGSQRRRERLVLCKCLQAGTTPGMRARWQASQSSCLQFERWSWQTPPQTNGVGVSFCGYLALQA